MGMVLGRGYRWGIEMGAPISPITPQISGNELGFAVTSKSYKRGWLWEQMPSLFTSLLKL